jgi:hypothetical protein
MCDLLITYQRKARHKLVLVSGAASECENTTTKSLLVHWQKILGVVNEWKIPAWARRAESVDQWW